MLAEAIVDSHERINIIGDIGGTISRRSCAMGFHAKKECHAGKIRTSWTKHR
jgi:hypothetical protein